MRRYLKADKNSMKRSEPLLRLMVGSLNAKPIFGFQAGELMLLRVGAVKASGRLRKVDLEITDDFVKCPQGFLSFEDNFEVKCWGSSPFPTMPRVSLDWDIISESVEVNGQ